jgi:hypothetical protein
MRGPYNAQSIDRAPNQSLLRRCGSFINHRSTVENMTMDSSEENKQQSTADMESAKSNNKEQRPANMESAESKNSADEASTLICGLKIDTADTEVTAAPSDVSSLPPTPATPAFNIVSITEKWSPESDRDAPERDVNPKFLPYDGEANPLCGGDFVFTVVAATSTEPEYIEAATISFLFCHDGKHYGMTVGHLKPSTGIDSALFAFATNEAMALKIGDVVAFSLSTDSLIFQLDDDIKADLYKVRHADDTKHVIDLSRAEVALNNLLAQGSNRDSVLVGRGVQRRGTEGVFSSLWTTEGNPYVRKNDVGMCWNGAAAGDGGDYSSKDISKEGDCGMIVFDGNGDPLSMHHAGFETTGAGPISYESYSVPLTRIIKAHQSFFPDVAVSENNDNLCIRRTTPQRRTSRLVPQIDASFLAKHKPIIKKKPGVLRLAQIPQYVPDRERQG